MRNAIIVDIDGTLSDLTHRLHYIQGDRKDWDGFFANVKDDAPLVNMISLVEGLSTRFEVILCSGRPERARKETIYWLGVNHVVFDELYMRQDKDHREDHIIKEENLELIKEKYNIVAAIDDRKQVVNMWRRNGILCLQCAEGDF